MKKMLILASLIAMNISHAGQYSELSQGQIEWGECTWSVAEDHGKTELYEQIVFNKKRDAGAYMRWEDFEIDVTGKVCGEMPGWYTTTVTGHEVLKQTYPK